MRKSRLNRAREAKGDGNFEDIRARIFLQTPFKRLIIVTLQNLKKIKIKNKRRYSKIIVIDTRQDPSGWKLVEHVFPPPQKKKNLWVCRERNLKQYLNRFFNNFIFFSSSAWVGAVVQSPCVAKSKLVPLFARAWISPPYFSTGLQVLFTTTKTTNILTISENILSGLQNLDYSEAN